MSEKRNPSTIENDDTPYTHEDLSQLYNFSKRAGIATINTESETGQKLVGVHFNRSSADPKGTMVVQTRKLGNLLNKTTTPDDERMDTQKHDEFVHRHNVDNVRGSADSWDQHTEGSRAFPGGKRSRKRRQSTANKSKNKTKRKRRNRGSKRIRRK